MLGGFSNPTVCELIQKAIKSVPAETIKSRMIEAMSANVEEELVKINVPILYLKATVDWFIPNWVSAGIKRLKPDVQIADVEGPHFLLQANPRVASAVILSFTAKV
jgi:pimeloyl-ACP methyl ester carboxylesterase